MISALNLSWLYIAVNFSLYYLLIINLTANAEKKVLLENCSKTVDQYIKYG